MSARLLRLAALDHFFDQDLRELETHPELLVRRIPYTRLRDRALAILGDDVGVGLEPFASPGLGPRRAAYAAWLAKEVERLYLEWPFDVFVLPSDSFFYVRALPPAAHRLGVPVAVVQKETTISPGGLDLHAPAVGRYAPFVSDLMTVCSELQRTFWLRAGTPDERIVVTGQPRFDLYARARERWRPRTPREVLFLSYELDAYEPGAGRGRGGRTWEELREGTEQVLARLGRTGRARVTVKHHPQQNLTSERGRLRTLAGDGWGDWFAVADPLGDTRALLASADVVVGFQSTALYESVAAGRPTIYAAWGPAFERYRDRLIPLDRVGDGVLHARSAGELEDLIARSVPPRPDPSAYEHVLGVVDGNATERTAEELMSLASDWVATGLAVELRTPSRRRRDAICRVGPSLARETVLRLAARLAPLLGKDRGAALRVSAAADLRRRLVRNLRGRG